jgi:hypothetical protein
MRNFDFGRRALASDSCSPSSGSQCCSSYRLTLQSINSAYHSSYPETQPLNRWSTFHPLKTYNPPNTYTYHHQWCEGGSCWGWGRGRGLGVVTRYASYPVNLLILLSCTILSPCSALINQRSCLVNFQAHPHSTSTPSHLISPHDSHPACPSSSIGINEESLAVSDLVSTMMCGEFDKEFYACR